MHITDAREERPGPTTTLITPIVLTMNEEENIGRTLGSLTAFNRVVVVDSGSSDATRDICARFPNVAWFERNWTGFGDQWNYALSETGVLTEWVLALDADMAVPRQLAIELRALADRRDIDGAVISFEYRIRGVSLSGSLYPPQLRLVRRIVARAGQIGHAHSLTVPGSVVECREKLIHDDRKPLEAFVRAQLGYSAVEVDKLFDAYTSHGVGAQVRRRFRAAPLLVWLLAWLRAGGPMGGAAASRYALERLLYEAMLRYRVDDRLLQIGSDGG